MPGKLKRIKLHKSLMACFVNKARPGKLLSCACKYCKTNRKTIKWPIISWKIHSSMYNRGRTDSLDLKFMISVTSGLNFLFQSLEKFRRDKGNNMWYNNEPQFKIAIWKSIETSLSSRKDKGGQIRVVWKSNYVAVDFLDEGLLKPTKINQTCPR
jgi:hypothetical protein